MRLAEGHWFNNVCLCSCCQGRIADSDANRPPFDLVVVHRERYPFNDKAGVEHYRSDKGDIALHFSYKYVFRTLPIRIHRTVNDTVHDTHHVDSFTRSIWRYIIYFSCIVPRYSPCFGTVLIKVTDEAKALITQKHKDHFYSQFGIQI